MGDDPARWPRVIVHADMDAFFAAVEQLDNPELLGRPLLVGGTGRRGVVCTASYEARPFGCRSAMPMAEARRRCPQAVVLPPNFARYQEVSRKVMETFHRFSPLVEPLSLDEAFLDMTGAEGIFGPPEEMGRRLRAEVREATGGLTVSAGVAASKYVAKVASDFRKPDGLTVVPPGTETTFLWPMSVTRLWGVGHKSGEVLKRAGMETIGDVARRDGRDIEKLLGEIGTRFHALAWGRDEREVVSEREAKSIGAETTLEEDLRGREEILPHLRKAAARVGRHLRKESLLAGGVRVKLKTGTFHLRTRQTLLKPPTDSEATLLSVATNLLADFDLTEPMRLVGLAAFNLIPGGGRHIQDGLFDGPDQERARRLDQTLDELRERFGTGAVRWGSDEDG